MNERYIKVFPVTDGLWTSYRIIDTKTWRQVGETSSRPIAKEIQAQMPEPVTVSKSFLQSLLHFLS